MLSNVCQRKGPKGLPVNILEAVCDGHACSNLHGARVPDDVRIGGEGRDCSSDELRRLRVGEVEPRPASMTFSVLTSPGYSETTATPWGLSSTAMSAVILSVAALATPYATLPMCFCAAQKEMLTISPRPLAIIDGAASWLAR